MPPDPLCVPDIPLPNTTDEPPAMPADASANHEAATLPPSAPPIGQEAETLAPQPANAEADMALSFAEEALLAGKYRLMQILGEGGMGAVWLAEQVEPVRRRVAVKLIKIGLDSEQVLTRFEAERQALAVMDHPNIAKVLDAGVDARGQPFFVMELMQGVPLTRFCDEARLTIRQRLELFVPICQAVQHAHQKGVIHRDLKPSNILVALSDGKPAPKVIDFGIAKATGQKLTEKTLQTQCGAVVGTLEYMSPEQADGATDIDTRADIYSLGVILYELLTGTTPLQMARQTEGALLDLLVRIREEEPPRPSLRLGMLETASSIAGLRQSDPVRLAKQLRVDLDWIVMKALEKDRARRYETANGFAADVLRYLGGEAVLAHPPSTVYRLRKFVKRYKGQVLAASVVFLALVAGIVGTTLGLLEAKKQEAEAKHQEGLALAAAENEKSARLEAQKNLQQAKENLAFAKKGNDILGSVFTGLDPNRNYATVGELSQALKDNLKKAVQELEGATLGDPLAVAQMQNTLGESLLNLGEPSQAIILFEKARAIRAARLDPDHPDTLQSMNDLALGYSAAGKFDRAMPLYEETLKLRRAKLGPYHPDTLRSMNNLAGSYQDIGKLDLALSLLEQTLKLMKDKLGPDHPDTLTSMNNLAADYWSARQLDKSVPLLEEILKLREKKLGRQHTETQGTVADLGVNYKDAGRVQEALPLLEEAFRTARTTPALRWVGRQLLDGYEKAGKSAETSNLVKELLADARKQLPKESPQLAGMLAQLGMSLLQAHAFGEAEPLLRECLAIRAKTQSEAWNTFNTMSTLGGALLGQKKYAEAEPLLLKGYEGMKQREKTISPQGVPRIPEALDRLIELYTATNKPDEAKKWRAERAKYPQGKTKTPERK